MAQLQIKGLIRSIKCAFLFPGQGSQLLEWEKIFWIIPSSKRYIKDPRG